MIFLNEQLWDHFKYPRNVGEWNENEANIFTGIAESPDGRAMVQIQIYVNAQDRAETIEDIRFKVYGDALIIALSSLFSENIKGSLIKDIAELDYKKLASAADLPNLKIEHIVLIEMAFVKAIRCYQSND